MIGTRTAMFVRSIVLVTALVVGGPWLLTWAARRRLGGPTPWSGVAPPGEWRWHIIRSALTDRLTESTLADLVVRTGLVVVWLAIGVLCCTVVAESVHMVRHGGLPMPVVRGLAPTQRLARVIAAGLVVVVPIDVRETVALHEAAERWPTAVEATPDPVPSRWPEPPVGGNPTANTPLVRRMPGEGSVAAPAGNYVVRAGDSIYGIAERMAGPDRVAVAAYADRLLDLNLGRVMADGQRFGNAAYIDIGWILQLPESAEIGSVRTDVEHHVVEPGETLWSIADDHLGDGEQWPDIFDANRGRRFDDGGTLDDPDLIRPGWELVVPSGDDARPAETANPALDPGDEVDANGDVDAEPGEQPRVDQHPTPSGGGPSMPSMPSDDPGEAVRSGQDPGGGGRDVERPSPPSPRPDNTWLTDGVPAAPDDRAAEPEESAAGVAAHQASVTLPTTVGDADRVVDGESEAELLTWRRAAMLSAGVITLLAVRRHERLRRARPHDRTTSRMRPPSEVVVSTERALRHVGAPDRFARVDLAVRAVASALVDQAARVEAIVVATDGAIELHASQGVVLEEPWVPTATGNRWRLPAATPIDVLAPDARRVGAPCPTLVQIGCDLVERDVYVDIEAIEALEVGGPATSADAIVTALASTLASSVLAEVVTLIGVGVDVDAFLGHRHHRSVRSADEAFEVASAAIGSTARAERSTFELRTRGTGGETWEPAVVLAGTSAGTITPPVDRTGLAVVSASPIHGPSSRLAPDGDGWTLLPLGLRLVPIGLSATGVGELAEVANASIDFADDPDVTCTGLTDEPRFDDLDADPGRESAAGHGGALDCDDGECAAGAELPHALVVRLLGPVVVESRDGEPVEFERSKTRELVAWLTTHRDRATRRNARTALWELDVRDATFANVVSEARRAMARCIEPPDGEEWIARTMTDALPVHDLVVTDVELLDHALETARHLPPDRAIATLRPAVDRIVGLPFEGSAYLWPDAEGITSSIVLRAITATSELASLCLSVGDIEGVFAASSAGLRVLPAHEEMIEIRMRAYAQIGDRAGVRSEWEAYERAITADPWSDGEPSERMLEVRRELLAAQ